jgi:hypothetical protein
MKVHLMFPNADFSVSGVRPSTEPLPASARDLSRDLDLSTIWAAMADGDPHLWEVARSATLSLATEPQTVRFRQEVLSDFRTHPEAARQLYELACDAMKGQKGIHRTLRRTPASTLRRGTEALELLLGYLRRLRAFADAYEGRFASEGVTGLVATLQEELDDQWFTEVAGHLVRLRFKNGVWLSAQLGAGNRGTAYVLRMPRDVQTSDGSGARKGWKRRVGARAPRAYSFEVHPRDEAGREALARFEDRALNLVANTLAQSTDHILDFFAQLRTEVAFYLGCLNLERLLGSIGAPMCTPEPIGAGTATMLLAEGLYDPALVLRTEALAVGNDVDADGRKLVMITGANSGGKSTLLRAIGLAQLMMQCGMRASATRYRASVCGALYTHFTRGEDSSMARGSFDEELSRMRGIAERLTPRAMVLFNESFAGTAVREGSEIAREIVQALLEAGVRVLFVTHLYDLAESLYMETAGPALFLRAERRDGGERTFKVLEGAPLSTSFAPDLYERIGGFRPFRSAKK